MPETTKNTKGPVRAKRGPYRSHLVSRGDVSHARVTDEVQGIVTDETTEAADQKELEALTTILNGEAPADRIRLLRLLLRQERLNYATTSSREDNPDDILVKDWRSGVYPYKNRLNRKTYEKEKFGLQVELLKLQAWIKETGQRVVILFEGRDAAGKGSWNTSIRVELAWLLWKSPMIVNSDSGTSNAMSNTYPREAKWFSLTALGTTVQGSNA